jgi:hypothetical protein
MNPVPANRLQTAFIQYGPLFAFFITAFGLLFVLNIYTPTWGDDWWRAVDPEDFSKIFERISSEYTGWTGRSVVLFVTFLSLFKYPGTLLVFALVNSAIFCILLAAIFRGAVGRWPGRNIADTLTLITAFISVWFLTQSFGEAILWKTGAVAYLWVITFSILALNPYVDLLSGKEQKTNTKTRLFVIPVAVMLLAISLENVAVAMTVFMLFALVVHWIQDRRPPLWYWVAFLGQVIGSIVLLAAPGNYARFAVQSDGTPIFVRFNKLLEAIWEHGIQDTYVFYVIISLLLLVAVTRIKVSMMRPWLWAFVAMMLAFAMAGSTGVNFHDRTAFVAEIGLIVTIIALAYPIWNQAKKHLQVVLPALGVISLVFVMDLAVVFEQYLATNQHGERRAELFAAYAEEDLEKIYMPSMKIPAINGLKDDIVDGRYFLRDLHGDMKGNEWRNGTFAKYYGFDFAWRVDKPYLVYLPEFKTNDAWNIHVSEDKLLIASRIDKLGYKTFKSVYVITPKSSCIRDFSTQHVDENGEKLKNNIISKQDVSVANRAGVPDNAYCAARLEIPLELEAVELSLPRNLRLSVDLLTKQSVEALPEFMNLDVLSWQACQLPKNAKAIVDKRKCTVEASSGHSNQIMTYGPYYNIEPGYYQAAITYQAWGGRSNWVQQLQYDGWTESISFMALEGTQGRISTETVEFEVTDKNGKLEVRSHFSGGRLIVHKVDLREL